MRLVRHARNRRGELLDEGGGWRLGGRQKLPRKGEGRTVDQLGGGHAGILPRGYSKAEHDPWEVGRPV
jgi:hypothetical protein